MNLPVGEAVKQSVALKDFNYRKEIEGFFNSGFSGYLVTTVEGFDGIEEGVLLFKEATLVGALYEYTNYGITVFGDIALPQVLNGLVADYGVVDVYRLTNQQVDLVTAFNDKVKLSRTVGKRDITKYFKKKFSSEYAEKTLSDVLKKYESRESIFKKLGLSGLKE